MLWWTWREWLFNRERIGGSDYSLAHKPILTLTNRPTLHGKRPECIPAFAAGLDFAFVEQRVLSRIRPAHRPEMVSARTQRFITPMLLLRKERLPEGPEWLYELKLDGYRAWAIKTGGKVHLRSCKHHALSTRYNLAVLQNFLNRANRVTFKPVVDVDVRHPFLAPGA